MERQQAPLHLAHAALSPPCASAPVQRLRKEMKKAIDEAVEERILNALVGETADPSTRRQFSALYRCVR